MEAIRNQEILRGNMRNELNYSELILQSDAKYEENYQLKMIEENRVEGILKVTVCNEDNCNKYIYDVSGLSTFQREIENGLCEKEEIKIFLIQLIDLIRKLNSYMLDVNCIVLDPQYIFYRNEKYYFCYYPVLEKTLTKSFHQLTECWVKSIDYYSDYGSVIFICGLHRGSMETHYSLEDLLEEFIAVQSKRLEPSMLKDSNTWNDMDEREELQKENELWKDRGEEIEGIKEIENIEEGNYEPPMTKVKNVIRETSFGKYWEQKKKEKWGDWDDLLTQEESFIMDKSKKIKE